MSLITDVTKGLSKAFSFFSAVVSKTAAVDKVWANLGPSTKAAILATFHDTVSTFNAAAAAVASAETGNIPGAIALSTATISMVHNVVQDAKEDITALANIVAAVKAEV